MSFFSFACLANSKKITIGVADFPPYSIVDGDNISGAEVDIIRHSLLQMGYEVHFKSFPYGRLPTAFSNKNVDATIVTLKNFDHLSVFYSDIVLPEYQTVAVHLKKQQLNISSIGDLEGKSIVAHQRAHLYYGDEYRRIAESQIKNTTYKETPHQKAQVLMLFRERAEVIVLAHEIFNYYKNSADYAERNKPFNIAKIFGEKFGFHNVFWHEKARNDFNQGLLLIKENGTYQKILSQYLAEYNR